MKINDLKAPFPYWGGKRRVAHIVWPRFGDVLNYVEPFAGSLAVLLARPYTIRTETVNDKDAYLANFWRAVQYDPDAVAHYADWPVNEADLHARHLWLVNQTEFRESMMTDPEYYDAKIAGWWVWGISAWIGSGWCDVSGAVFEKRPHLADSGSGIHRKLPNPPQGGGRGVGSGAVLTRNGRSRPNLRPKQGVEGLSRQIPHLNGDSGAAGGGIHATAFDRKTGGIYDYMAALQQRLRRARVTCGDWKRITGKSVTWKIGTTAVFLDPPYNKDAGRADGLYAVDDLEISTKVREWALAEGNNPKMRIALCGYEDEHGPYMPDDWQMVAWKANGGYANQNNQGNNNRHEERIWFSPYCLNPHEPLQGIVDSEDYANDGSLPLFSRLLD